MADDGRLKEYRFLEVSLGDRRTLRVLVHHPMCANYVQALSSHLPVKDITGRGIGAEPLHEVDVLFGWKLQASLLSSLASSP
jgi:hypothetical protein